MKEKTERAKYWEALIAEQAASESTVKAFCGERELSEASFYWWRRELKGLNRPRRRRTGVGPGAFVQVTASGQPAACGTSGVAVRVAGGMSIVLDPGFDRETLGAVLGVLRESGPCLP